MRLKVRWTTQVLPFLVVSQVITGVFSRCARRLLSVEQQQISAFLSPEEAMTFLGRHLLYNRFDFELFTPGNLERECYEEICNYEEAREVFEDTAKTDAFWKDYIKNGPYANPGSNDQKVDVTALITGLIAGGVSLFIIALLCWYFCCRIKRRKNVIRMRQNSPSSNPTSGEEISLNTMPTQMEDTAHGLPSYDQAFAMSGQYDAPPPPYPGSRSGSLHQ
ncbi:transmembrane gamma-carboxyglutamic acid protein 4 [Erpetoichthys calabaricus]|uniref:transmembrane gamma-carboxyglutamic acid protein 4 n=1 Tax=Erpetoichthys calabaricus TaxID=27687 RepID=UPI002234BBA8|nr:transmembrane gamma-carboxyglutamic acid protein 4 [Erpetoichthys calabaricus]